MGLSPEEMQQLGNYAQDFTRQMTIESSVSEYACCVGGNGSGGYNFRTADGRNISDVIPLDDFQVGSGDWRTIEKTADGWVVAGASPVDGGPVPD